MSKSPSPPSAINPATPIVAPAVIPSIESAKSSPSAFPRPRTLIGGAFRYRGLILGGAVVVFGAGKFISNKLDKARRDFVDPNGTVIYWNVFDGAIVEEKDPSSLYVVSACPLGGGRK